MGKKRKTLDRCVAFALVCVLSVGFMPTWVFAEEAGSTETSDIVVDDTTQSGEPMVVDDLAENAPYDQDVTETDLGEEDVPAVVEDTGEDVAAAIDKQSEGEAIEEPIELIEESEPAEEPKAAEGIKPMGDATLSAQSDEMKKGAMRSISKAAVAKIVDYAYTTKAHKPQPKVTLGGKTLRLNTDYKLSYANNVNPGTATITITGKGSYTGTKKVTFRIVAPKVLYRSYRQSSGWESNWKANGSVSGSAGQFKRIEGVRIRLASGYNASGGFRYRSYVQSSGWEKQWKYNGETSGTTGKSKRIEAIQVSLTGGMDANFNVWYRVCAQTYGWMGWAKNGARAGTTGYGKRIEAIQVVVMAKGKTPSKTYKGATQKTSAAFKQKTTSTVTISGTGWKTTLPNYWKGKVAKSSATDSTYGRRWEVWPSGLKRYTLVSAYVTSGSTYSSLARIPSQGNVKLKSGQTARVVWLGSGWIGFITKTNRGQTLVVATASCDPTALRDRGISYNASNVGIVEDLQSFGAMSYTWNTPEEITLTCLRRLAVQTTLT